MTLPTPVGSTGLASAVEAAEAAGVLVVAPADPLPEDQPGYTYPATYDPVLAVARSTLTGFQPPTGPVTCSHRPRRAWRGCHRAAARRGHTVAITGTLPAAAYVAGVAALVRAAYPDLSPAELRLGSR